MGRMLLYVILVSTAPLFNNALAPITYAVCSIYTIVTSYSKYIVIYFGLPTAVISLSTVYVLVSSIHFSSLVNTIYRAQN